MARVTKILKSQLKLNYSSIRAQTTHSDAKYCLQYVRKCDNENYLCTSLLPKQAMTGAFAIRAFNAEVAQAKDAASNRQIAEMRLQFWKDSLNDIYKGQARPTPIAKELSYAVSRYQLSKKWFFNIIEARENNLEDQPFINVQEMLNYSDKVNSSLNYLILQCLDVHDMQADHVASHLGKCQGIITVLRAIPYHAQRRRVLLPIDLTIKHNVSQQEVIRGCREQKMKDLIYDIASEANHELEMVQQSQKDVPKAAFPALLPAVCCDAYLKSLQKTDFDIFDSRLRHKNGWLPMLLWWKNKRKVLK